MVAVSAGVGLVTILLFPPAHTRPAAAETPTAMIPAILIRRMFFPRPAHAGRLGSAAYRDVPGEIKEAFFTDPDTVRNHAMEANVQVEPRCRSAAPKVTAPARVPRTSSRRLRNHLAKGSKESAIAVIDQPQRID